MACASALLESGAKVTVIDVGRDLAPEREAKRTALAERLTRPLPEILWRLAIEQSPFGSRIDELIAEKPLDWDAIAKALQIAG